MKEGKDQAYDARCDFKEKCKKIGVNLIRLSKVLFRTDSGKRIIVPFANEKKDEKRKKYMDRWWLGFYGGNDDDCPYDLLVALCRSQNNNDVYPFIIPKLYLKKNWTNFSRNDSGDVQLNIVKDGPEFYLSFPPRKNERITHFLDNFDYLKSL